MDTAVEAKLIEILRQAYGGELSKAHAACLAAQAELAENGEREVADYRRCMTHGTLSVRITPFALHGPGGNHAVRFVVELSDPSGEAGGTVDCEAALTSMERWLVTAADLTLASTVPSVLERAILAVVVDDLKRVDCP